MEYKKAISDTLEELKGSFRPADDSDFFRSVTERAIKMEDRNENATGGIRVYDPLPEQKKHHGAAAAVVGAVLAAAAIAGTVFGLNTFGGLKENIGTANTGAAYHDDSSYAETAIRADGKWDHIFEFRGVTVAVNWWKFDGKDIYLHYDLIFDGEPTAKFAGGDAAHRVGIIGDFEGSTSTELLGQEGNILQMSAHIQLAQHASVVYLRFMDNDEYVEEHDGTAEMSPDAHRELQVCLSEPEKTAVLYTDGYNVLYTDGYDEDWNCIREKVFICPTQVSIGLRKVADWSAFDNMQLSIVGLDGKRTIIGEGEFLHDDIGNDGILYFDTNGNDIDIAEISALCFGKVSAEGQQTVKELIVNVNGQNVTSANAANVSKAKTEVPATFDHKTSGRTITVNSYEFDGKTLNLNWDVVFDDELEKYHNPEGSDLPLVKGMKNMDAFSFMGEPDENIKYVFMSTNSISDRTINHTMTVELGNPADSLDLIFPPTVHEEFDIPEYTFTAAVNAGNVKPAVNENTGKTLYNDCIYPGMTLAEALIRLKVDGIDYDIEMIESDEIPAGKLIRTEPEIRSDGGLPGKVTVYASTGKMSYSDYIEPNKQFTLADGSTGYVSLVSLDNFMCSIKVRLHNDSKNYFVLNGCPIGVTSPGLNVPADLVETYPWGFSWSALEPLDDPGHDMECVFFTPIKDAVRSFEVYLEDVSGDEKSYIGRMKIEPSTADGQKITFSSEDAETGKRNVTLSPTGFMIRQEGGSYRYETMSSNQYILVKKSGKVVYNLFHAFCSDTNYGAKQLIYGVFNDTLDLNDVYSITLCGGLYEIGREKSTSISIKFSDIRNPGEYEFLYYIDGKWQKELTETREISEMDEFRWDISGSGIHTYKVQVTRIDNGSFGTLFECTVDFYQPEPVKDFHDTFNGKLFKQLADPHEQGDLSLIEGIYGPGEEPPYEVIEGDGSENANENAYTLPESISSINRNDLLTEWAYGDDAWAVLQQLGDIGFGYCLPYDRSLFYYYGYGFNIDYADCDVTALVGGTVEFTGYHGGYGNCVLILDENGHYWLYYHLRNGDLPVAAGDTVSAGDVIGHTGTSGVTDKQKWALRVA